MRSFLNIFAVILLSLQCSSQPLEETVVSVYTTHPTTMGTNPPIDVYHQIANNIAERITSPIYKFLGLNGTKSQSEATTKSVENIELEDDQDLVETPNVKQVENDLTDDRDVEEISIESISKRNEKKPEKITLYSKYLPTLIKSSQFSGKQVEAKNDSWNELDDPFTWDDDEVAKPKEGPLIYFLELLGSTIQLLWGGLMALFRPNSSSESGNGML